MITAGADVDQLVDDVFDLSRELSFVVQSGEYDHAPRMNIGAPKHEPEERAQTDNVSTAASSMPIGSAGVIAQSFPPLTHFRRNADF